MDNATIWWILAWLLILVGLAGTVLPALPGIIFMFGGMWLAAWIDAYQRIGTATLIVLGVLTLISFLTDTVAGIVGAKRFGASRQGMLGSVVGGIVGLFFGLPGLLLGPLFGAVVGEFMAHRDMLRAGRAGFGAWLGQIVGAALKVGIAFAMLAIFVFAYFF